MSYKIKLLGILTCTLSLSACIPSNENENGYNTLSYTAAAEEAPFYAENFINENSYNPQPEIAKEENEANTYYVSATHPPASHKDQDKMWVASQNPQHYTIELADEAQPVQVAYKLFKAPKNERSAEVKYQRNGKTYFKGVYGNFNDYQSAQQALNALPVDIRSGASVKNWGVIQNRVNE